ncbi:MAG TPA: hypothetical protein VLK65_27890 [Vicinamibacteria bacterium]|nr:hypothetical protein [Vicinamibacteria bacterium]
MRRVPLRIAVLLVVWCLSAVFFIDLCARIFDCGCLSLWNGAASFCNIHAVDGPHCPWCAHPAIGGGMAFFSTMAAQLGIVLAPGSVGSAMRLAGALVAFPIVSGIVGWAQGLALGYWSH